MQTETFAFHKTFERDALADGGTFSDSWTADENYRIKRVHISEKGGRSLTASTFYWKIGNRIFSREVTPANMLGPDVLVTPVIDVPITKGEKLDFTFVNKEGVTISVFITLEVHK